MWYATCLFVAAVKYLRTGIKKATQHIRRESSRVSAHANHVGDYNADSTDKVGVSEANSVSKDGHQESVPAGSCCPGPGSGLCVSPG